MLPLAFQLAPQFLVDIADKVLVFFHDDAGLSWGGAIIALTVFVRALLIPLTYKQLKGMRALQALQPQIKEIQAKYKNDKQRMQQEMMRFYQENKVNPFASCIPLIAQLPVFITLFYVLQHDLRFDICGQTAMTCSEFAAKQGDAAGFFGESFLFIPDLTAKAEGGVLIALLVIYVGTRADLRLGYGCDGGQKPAHADVRAAADLRPVHHQLPRRADPLLDHDQRLDDRAAVRDPESDSGARGGDSGGGRGYCCVETATAASEKKKKRRR